jgi:uncharacterized protein YcgI (DUF1989 family)
MAVIHDETVRVNSGAAWVVRKGQRIRVNFDTVMDFVVFNLDNLTERFDQARTKANQSKIWVTRGDVLYSKINTVMMTIVEDTYQGKGKHDLQYGMCSKWSFDEWWRRREEPRFREWFARGGVARREDLPLWGCYENLMTALQNYPITPLDIPAPLNIGQSMDIDAKTGIMTHAWADRDRPDPGTYIDLRAEMDCLCAGSADPGMGKVGRAGQPVRVQIFDS